MILSKQHLQEIAVIAHTLETKPAGFVAGVACDTDEKADAYLAEIQKLVPSVVEVKRVFMYGTPIMQLKKEVVQ